MASDEPRLVVRIVELATAYGRYGYRRITALLRREGWKVNHKRVERIWRREGLKVPRKQPKRGRLGCPMPHRSRQFLSSGLGFHLSFAPITIDAGVRPRVR